MSEMSMVVEDMVDRVLVDQKWQKLGTLRHSSWGKPCRTVWLAEKPVRRGGAWGIGCTFCAFLVDELAKHPEERKRLNLNLIQ